MSARHLRRALAALTSIGLAASLAFAWQALAAGSRARQLEAALRAPAGASLPADAPDLQLVAAERARRAGDWQAALERYDALAQRSGDAAEGRIAAYDAAQLLLAQALDAQRRGDAARALPLAELAKERLRGVLRAHPDAWDARYNLERALRIAPEEREPERAHEPPNSDKRSMRQGGPLAPELP